jgi:hypothetical protein
LPLLEADIAALCRATTVALSAAFERYIVELFSVLAVAAGLTDYRVQQHLLEFSSGTISQRLARALAAGVGVLGLTQTEASALRAEAGGPRRRFANPNARNVRLLFQLVFPGDDIWAGVCTLSNSEEMVQGLVNRQQDERHALAHGRDRKVPSPAEVGSRLAEFELIVCALDDSAADLTRRRLGECPWQTT